MDGPFSVCWLGPFAGPLLGVCGLTLTHGLALLAVDGQPYPTP